MSGESSAPRARTRAMVCTGLGLMAMAVAPFARTAFGSTPPGSPGLTPAAIASRPAPALAVAGEERAARTRVPEAPSWVDADAVAGKAFVFPPQDEGETPKAKPVTVLLHGMCGEPRGACGPFVDVSTSRGWLVCPKAEDACGGGTRWRVRGPDDGELVEASVRGVAREHRDEIDPSAPRVIVGFSLGGTAAVRIAEASQGTYKGLVVIASLVHPNAEALKKAGVERVVLAAGELDMTNGPLQADARAMEKQGLSTRFVSLGHFGHGYPADMETRMHEPMQWVAGGG